MVYISDRVEQPPFLLYAARHWAAHASICSEELIGNTMIEFLKDDHKVSNAAQALFSTRMGSGNVVGYQLHRGLEWGGGSLMSGMHFAVYFGLKDTITMLLNNGFAADVRDVSNRSLLFWAAMLGNSQMVGFFFSHSMTWGQT